MLPNGKKIKLKSFISAQQFEKQSTCFRYFNIKFSILCTVDALPQHQAQH